MTNQGPGARILLLHPPYADFTCPYHSLSYVAAPLRAAGYEVDVIDVNAVWFRRVFRTEKVAVWKAELERRIADGDRRDKLTVDEQIGLVSDIRALALCRALEPERAVQILQGEAFYDPVSYAWAQEQVQSFETLLDKFYAPHLFSRAFSAAPQETDSRQMMDRALQCPELIEEFACILREMTAGANYLFCGVTAPYSVNLVPALSLLDAVAREFPGVPRVAGGTAVVDIYKYKASSATLNAFSPLCDFFWIGEAENGVAELARYFEGGAAAPPPQALRLADEEQPDIKHTYVALARHEASRGRFAAYDWAANSPDYDWIDWSLYLSPEKRINYAPSRGCFWNKCTFCDYGLNEDGPTAPVRSVDVDVAIRDVRALADAGIRRIYLAADAVSPSFLGKFADGVIEAGLDVSWTCQVFLTKNFTPELVSKLQRAGMVIASFGLESGSAPVLEKMGKGKNRVAEVLHPSLQAFQASAIGLQPLFFYGFPGETSSDRQATVDFLLAYQDVFSPISRGGLFGLMSGSMIAKAPQRYGLSNLRPMAEGDIVGEYDFVSSNPEDIRCARDAYAFDSQLPTSERFERPWAGGVDTLHSQLYVERYGREVFDKVREMNVPRSNVRIAMTSAFDLECAAETAVIAVSARVYDGRISLPAETDALFAEALVPLERSPSAQTFTLEFVAGA